MNKTTQTDFRVTFGRLAEQAIVTRAELAELLATTPGALSQMAYRGELPATAFPGKRRACWYAKDIRVWLDEVASRRGIPKNITSISAESAVARTGRPRLPIVSSEVTTKGKR
jgi:hypothetical protein